jgi:DNA-binding NtrC family response regulator
MQTVSDLAIEKGTETILLVDDNDTARDFICETLEYCGYKLLTASSGNEAAKIMHQTDYGIDLLLTDIVMPGINGTELAEIAQNIYPGIKVLLMSGYADIVPDGTKETTTPKIDLLQKPMSIETLSQKIRKALDQ